jgi:FdhE protein
VELRGLERRRVMRCGRCAAAWEREVLHCAFCGERDHRRQGMVTAADEEHRVRVETCASCGGYLKGLTTLRPLPAWALPLEDLRTLPLELTVLERGFRRPTTPGWMATLAVVPASPAP